MCVPIVLQLFWARCCYRSLAVQPRRTEKAAKGRKFWRCESPEPLRSELGQWHALPRRSIAVRFTPVSGIHSRSQGLPSRANSGREQMQQSAGTIPIYSTTSSAIASNPDGISIPSARAVCKLMVNSNLVVCCTGISAGFAPCRTLPV
jgi:hypothetical protein